MPACAAWRTACPARAAAPACEGVSQSSWPYCFTGSHPKGSYTPHSSAAAPVAAPSTLKNREILPVFAFPAVARPALRQSSSRGGSWFGRMPGAPVSLDQAECVYGRGRFNCSDSQPLVSGGSGISRRFASILMRSRNPSGGRSEMVWVDGLRFGSRALAACVQSTYSVQSCISQKVRSAISLLNDGTTLFKRGALRWPSGVLQCFALCVVTDNPLLAVHVSSRDHPNQGSG